MLYAMLYQQRRDERGYFAVRMQLCVCVCWGARERAKRVTIIMCTVVGVHCTRSVLIKFAAAMNISGSVYGKTLQYTGKPMLNF